MKTAAAESGMYGHAVRVLAGLLVTSAAVTVAPADALPAPGQTYQLTVPAGAVFRDCEHCPEMVVIPPGDFTMGHEGGEPGRYEGPVREMQVAHGFALGRYEVTQAQFTAFAKATGHASQGGCRIWDGTAWQEPEHADWTDPGYGRAPADDEPVACVSWLDARAYVAWLSELTGQVYRLPSEAEWEYAARAGSDADFYWGDDESIACRWANVYDTSGHAEYAFPWDPVGCDDGQPGVAIVGQYPPNAFGLYDILGNVWEWVEDCYLVPYPDDGPRDGSAVQVEGPCDRRSVRGGSWITRMYRHRLSWRGRDPEPTLFSFFGFRVARDLAPLEANR